MTTKPKEWQIIENKQTTIEITKYSFKINKGLNYHIKSLHAI